MKQYKGKCYKYRTFSCKPWLEDIILGNRLWFSRPTAFNDPYDCQPAPVWEGDFSKAVKLMVESMRALIAQGKSPSYSQKELERKARTLIWDRERVEQALRDGLNESARVCCMSKSWQSLPQWAYYADNGSGLCLEFNLGKAKPVPPAFEVVYSDDRPKVDLVGYWYDPDKYMDEVKRAITTKSSDWSYESEVRLFASRSGACPFPEAMLTRILVGQKAAKADVEWLRDLVASRALDTVPIYSAQICRQTFGLEQVPLPGSERVGLESRVAIG